MFAHQFFDRVSIAPLERLDDAHVIYDRLIRAMVINVLERLNPDCAHVQKQGVGHRLDQVAMTQSDQCLVKFDIGIGLFVDMRAHLFVVESGE